MFLVLFLLRRVCLPPFLLLLSFFFFFFWFLSMHYEGRVLPFTSGQGCGDKHWIFLIVLEEANKNEGRGSCLSVVPRRTGCFRVVAWLFFDGVFSRGFFLSLSLSEKK